MLKTFPNPTCFITQRLKDQINKTVSLSHSLNESQTCLNSLLKKWFTFKTFYTFWVSSDFTHYIWKSVFFGMTLCLLIRKYNWVVEFLASDWSGLICLIIVPLWSTANFFISSVIIVFSYTFLAICHSDGEKKYNGSEVLVFHSGWIKSTFNPHFYD